MIGTTPSSPDVPVDVRPCGDGPLLVRHAATVTTDDGEVHEVTRPVVAVCTCLKSQRMPWCDSTHKFVRRGAGRS